MGYLKRVVLVNSAGYQLADVRLDGHCDMAGGQGVGKTTLMNAILFPFVVEDQYLDIDTREKTRFSLYYFKNVNSFVIYEVVNNLNATYSILINRTGPSLNFHFISAPFDLDWLYNGEEQVTSWSDVRQKLIDLGINYKTEDRMWKFNSIFLGKGDSYNEQYSIVRTPKDRDAVRPLISAIFKNRPFTQENLKEILVAAVMSSNQVETEGIELASHKSNLENFAQRYSDIKKMTVKGKNGFTAIEPIAEEIFRQVKKYHQEEDDRKLIPGLFAYSYAETQKRKDQLVKELASLDERQRGLDGTWEKDQIEIQSQLDELNKARGENDSNLKRIKELEQKYKEISIDDLVQWIREKKVHEAEKKALEQRYRDLTGDTPDIREEMEKALDNNIQVYRNKELIERGELNKKMQEFEARRRAVSAKSKEGQNKVEKEFEQLLGKDWQSTEIELIDSLLDLSKKLATAETVEDIRTAIKEKGNLPEIEEILSDVFRKRIESDASVEELKVAFEDARANIAKEIDRKVQLERQKQDELTKISDKEKEAISIIDQEEENEKAASRESLRAIVQECKDKASEIRADYESKMHGGDESLKSILEELNVNISSEEYVLNSIEEFPAAIEDKAILSQKAIFVAKREQINLQYNQLTDLKSTKKKAYTEDSKSISSERYAKQAKLQEEKSNIADADRFLEHKSDVKVTVEECVPIENDKTLKDIIQSYEDIRRNLDELRDTLPEAVRRLYGPDMLSRVDTFELGIGLEDSLSTFDEFLAVAEKLRTRLENSEENMGMDKFIRLNTNVWLDELRDISTAMSPVQSMLVQIQKLCRKTTEFIKANNKTDCIDDFSMSVDEKDTTDTVRMLREIATFYNKNNLTLGFDNLFSSEGNEDNNKAVALLEKLSVELGRSGEQKISLTAMFDIRMDITEKGNPIKNLLSIRNPGSKGTAVVLKAMLNMALLHMFLENSQADNTHLICAIDEMNTIEASNLHALTEFATAAGMYIIGSGQHHTNTALDYSYNVFDIPAGDGTRIKEISLDARELTEEEL